MAWQTPKTNWTAADGVRDTDLNRIEENILELYNGAALRQNITLYVSTSGNDTTGEGTYAKPYATLTKALSVLPKNLNGATITIDIAPGTYPGDVNIVGFHGGTLYVSCAGNITFSGTVTIDNSNYVRLYAYGITANRSIAITRGSMVLCEAPITCSNSAQYGIRADYGSKVIINERFTCSNKSVACVYAMGADVHLLDVVASTSPAALHASLGGRITYRGSTITTTTNYVTESGGRIYAGSQENVPEY